MKRKKQKWEPTLPNGTVIYCCDALFKETFEQCERKLEIQSISYEKNKKIEHYTLQGSNKEISMTVQNGKIKVLYDKKCFLNKEKAFKFYINDCKRWLKFFLKEIDDYKRRAIESEISAKEMQDRIKSLVKLLS
jgi:hypothetical protein